MVKLSTQVSVYITVCDEINILGNTSTCTISCVDIQSRPKQICSFNFIILKINEKQNEKKYKTFCILLYYFSYVNYTKSERLWINFIVLNIIHQDNFGEILIVKNYLVAIVLKCVKYLSHGPNLEDGNTRGNQISFCKWEGVVTLKMKQMHSSTSPVTNEVLGFI